VLPAIGLLLDSWLGILVGVILYGAARIFAPEEEKALAKAFGADWDEYCKKVKIAWL
jgi:protein-S-isoprenylcysteine O-methyltransferase Ste14